MNNLKASLPAIIAGPMLRQVSPSHINLWLISSSSFRISARLINAERTSLLEDAYTSVSNQQIKVGEYAYINMITLQCQQPLIDGTRYYYDLFLDNDKTSLGQRMQDLLYPGESTPSFVYKSTISNLLHGSCRKPHHKSKDGLLAVDKQLEQGFSTPECQPDLLVMSGDQVYIDDVAGPTLHGIHRLIELLELFDTTLPIDSVKSSHYLSENNHLFYQRDQLLPDTEANERVISQFILGKKKPIFTSVNANNHLITFAEVIAMYILVWSPEMWPYIDFDKANVPDKFKTIYEQELLWINDFVTGLGHVRRALAHVPVYMIFDDHDVTDDWNLTRGWEEAVYNHPFAKRIVGNALIGYWLCQGWGNDPIGLSPLVETLLPHFTREGIDEHDELVDKLLQWDHWHYNINTEPKIVVLDTRTQRWRSESSLNKPSGLMDWEALCELQQELINQPAVIMVSPAPIFGVKLIEAVQRIFTFFGKPLMVDAENWMAHKGTANVILNIFRHIKTPANFVILSGDVHYSFVYDITLKLRRNTPHITQITSSGIKNEFPAKLLQIFDYLNRILYGHKSPLNWLTKRRYMRIKHRRPGTHKLSTLLNESGIGRLSLSDNAQHVDASVITSDGESVIFHSRD